MHSSCNSLNEDKLKCNNLVFTEHHKEEWYPLVVGDEVRLVVGLALFNGGVHGQVVGALHETQVVGVVHPRGLEK